LQEIHDEILKMGSMVEEALDKALQAFREKNVLIAQKVIDEDCKIDEMQLLIEDRCMMVMATEQPVASDLRNLLTTIKIASSLERIADHAVHLSKTTTRLEGKNQMDPLRKMIEPMAKAGIEMVSGALTALADHDTEKAREVAERDEFLDDTHMKLFDTLVNYQREHPEYSLQTTDLLFLIRFLERLGDHVTHICEWIILRETGKHTELND
jgi:phosphate transport system protein